MRTDPHTLLGRGLLPAFLLKKRVWQNLGGSERRDTMIAVHHEQAPIDFHCADRVRKCPVGKDVVERMIEAPLRHIGGRSSVHLRSNACSNAPGLGRKIAKTAVDGFRSRSMASIN
jgi:hypothetical protein